MTAWRPLVAEALGTFFLVFIGTGAIVVNSLTSGALTHVGIALAFGMIVACMILSLGHISGAHINPAVTLAFWALGRLQSRRAAAYAAAQIIGALGAAALLRALFPAATTLGETLPSGGDGVAFAMEFILSFLLMFVILNSTQALRNHPVGPALAIGMTVALCALVGGPVSGASMNPARSIGPALLAGQLAGLWIYIAAPLLGTLAAARIDHILQSREPEC